MYFYFNVPTYVIKNTYAFKRLENATVNINDINSTYHVFKKNFLSNKIILT